MMADTLYGKGISVASGFDLGAKSPLDTRIVANTIEERNAHATGNRAYEGMIVYVIEDETNYQYINSEWVKFKAGELGVDIVDDLESTDKGAVLSANQGRVLKEYVDSSQAEMIVKLNELEDNVRVLIEEAGTGNANIHIGSEPPVDTSYLWIDTTAPYNFDVSTYDGRMRLKYIEMLELTMSKLLGMEDTMTKIEESIDKLTGEEVTNFRTELSKVRGQITIIQSNLKQNIQSIIDGNDLENLKNTSKNLRKQTKKLLYDLSDINTNILRVIDGQNKIENNEGDKSGGGSDTPTTDVPNLLTDDGRDLLTEDGLLLLLDGVSGDVILTNAILTELGLVILTEDGRQILKD